MHNIYANPKIHFRNSTLLVSALTKPTGRRYPKYVRHWKDFHNLHKNAFEEISNQLEAQAFRPRKFYQAIAEEYMPTCILSNEAQLVAYQERSVEALVIEAWKLKGDD